MARDHGRAKAVDSRLQDYRTYVNDRSHKSHGISLSCQFPIQLLFKDKILPARYEYPRLLQYIADAKHSADPLGDHSGSRSTPHSHSGTCDQSHIKNDIQDRRNDQEDQGHGGIADCPQQRRKKIVGEHHRDPPAYDPDVCECLCVNCLWCPQDPQERPQSQQRQYRHYCDRSGSDHQRPGHRLSQPALVAGSVGSGHNYTETVSQRLGKHDHQVKDRDVCSDCRQ